LVAGLFFGHMVAVGLAWQPMYTFLRTQLSDAWMVVSTAILPAGAFGSYLISRQLLHWPRWSQTRWRVGVSQLILSALYGILALLVGQLEGDLASPAVAVLPISVCILLIGCAQPIAFSGLTAAGLRHLPRYYPIVRSAASIGFIAAGFILAGGMAIDGTHLRTASALMGVVGASACLLLPNDSWPKPVDSPDAGPTVPSSVGSANWTGSLAPLMAIAMTLSFAECTHNIQTQTMLTEQFGPRGNALIQAGVLLEIALLLAMPWLLYSLPIRRVLFIAGPAGWMVLAIGMMLVARAPWAAWAVVGLGLNAPWQTLVAHRLGPNPHQQIKLTTAQAVGSLTAFLTTWVLAIRGAPLQVNWGAALTIAAVGGLLASAVARYSDFVGLRGTSQASTTGTEPTRTGEA
jgi:hypothetical protein